MGLSEVIGMPQIIQVMDGHFISYWNLWWLGDPPWLRKPMKPEINHRPFCDIDIGGRHRDMLKQDHHPNQLTINKDFHSHGDTPITGCFLSWKIPNKNGWWLGIPLFQETSRWTCVDDGMAPSCQLYPFSFPDIIDDQEGPLQVHEKP